MRREGSGSGEWRGIQYGFPLVLHALPDHESIHATGILRWAFLKMSLHLDNNRSLVEPTRPHEASRRSSLVETGGMPRSHGIDLVKALGAFAVVLIHCFSTPPELAWLKDLVVNLARFAVPLFFVASGYFFAQAIARQGSARRAMVKVFRRLGLLWLAWNSFYLVDAAWRQSSERDETFLSTLQTLGVDLWDHWAHTLMAGTAYHMWFLSSLIFCLGTCALLDAGRWRHFLLPLGVTLYLAGLMQGSYGMMWPHLDVGLDHRTGLLFGLLPVAIGTRLSQRPFGLIDRTAGWVLLAGGALLHFAEVTLLHRSSGVAWLQIDYVMGTLGMGIGVFLLGRSLNVSSEWVRKLAWIGRWAGGIYFLHVFFVVRLNLVAFRFPALVWVIAAPVLVFGTSLVLVWAASRIRWLRPFTM